jgi:bacteriocin biosynthesis cyclodehydratase domain-containing protein
MLKRPKFKDCFHVELMESDHVFLLREKQYKVLSGTKYKQLAALLDGNRTIVEITLALGGQISFNAVQYMVNQMEAQGYLGEGNGDDNQPSHLSAFLYALGTDAHAGKARIAQSRITLTTIGGVDATPLRTALEQEGVMVVEEEGDLCVVLVEDYLQAEIETINHVALADKRPWLLVKLTGTKSWIGPLFQPYESACWACLRQRIRMNRQVESFLARQEGFSSPIVPPLVALPTTVAVAAGMVATEIVKWIALGRNPRLENTLLTYDHLTMALDKHTVVRRPQCPACSDAAYESVPHSITYTHEDLLPVSSGLRIHPSEAVFERYRHHISPISGVITRLNDNSRDSSGLVYNFVAGHYFPLIIESVKWLRLNLKLHTGGKGITQMQAKMGAMGEAFERFSTCYRGEEVIEHGTYTALKERALHPHGILGYSDHQYDTRDDWNVANIGSYQVVPNRFPETEELEWTPLWSLTNQEFKLVPAALCYYGHPDLRHFFNTIDSNGVAAGSTQVEAVVQGFGELVERDSVAIWWYNRLSRPGVDLSGFNNPYLATLQAHYQQMDREYWVLDITNDLGIPAFAAISRRTDVEVEDIIYGFGAHFDPQTAIMQAVVEMNQCLPGVTFKQPNGKTEYRWEQQDAVTWWKSATVANQPYLLPDTTVPLKQLSDYPTLAKATLKANLELCVDILRNVGLEMFMLDVTRPDVGINVCRVVVPGMCHFWRRLGPGRLYNVPVQLGWLTHPRQEDEMNPYAIFF